MNIIENISNIYNQKTGQFIEIIETQQKLSFYKKDRSGSPPSVILPGSGHRATHVPLTSLTSHSRATTSHSQATHEPPRATPQCHVDLSVFVFLRDVRDACVWMCNSGNPDDFFARRRCRFQQFYMCCEIPLESLFLYLSQLLYLKLLNLLFSFCTCLMIFYEFICLLYVVFNKHQ